MHPPRTQRVQGKRTLGHKALAVPVVTMPRARPRLLSKYWQVMVSVAVKTRPQPRPGNQRNHTTRRRRRR